MAIIKFWGVWIILDSQRGKALAGMPSEVIYQFRDDQCNHTRWQNASFGHQHVNQLLIYVLCNSRSVFYVDYVIERGGRCEPMKSFCIYRLSIEIESLPEVLPGQIFPGIFRIWQYEFKSLSLGAEMPKEHADVDQRKWRKECHIREVDHSLLITNPDFVTTPVHVPKVKVYDPSPLLRRILCGPWCPEPESNRHGPLRVLGILSPVCLPIPPSGHREARGGRHEARGTSPCPAASQLSLHNWW
jgi:hypothetical protein